MTMQFEKSLKDFEFWGGAAENSRKLTPAELDEAESYYENMLVACDYGAPTITEINDFFWFDFETICEWLDLDYDEVMARE